MTDVALLAAPIETPPVERPAYRYLATDVRTGTRLGELPLGGVDYSEELNRAGTLNATIDLAAAGDVRSAVIPRRTALWAYRGNTIMWGGIIWTAQRAGRQLKITAGSFWSYWARRKLVADVAAADDDQCTVAQTIVQWAQTRPGGDIRVIVEADTSGVLITRQVARLYELKDIGPLVEELAAEAGGFDFAVTVAQENDVPVARFRTFYPRRGRRADVNSIRFTFRLGTGGNLIDYDFTEDGLSAATTVYGMGAGDGADMLITESPNTAMIDAGYPLQEVTVPYRDIDDQAVLLRKTNAAVAARSETPTTWGLVVDPDDVSFPLGSWTVGDDATIVIEEDYGMPRQADGRPALETVRRVVGQKVVVPDNGGPEKVTLTVAEAWSG